MELWKETSNKVYLEGDSSWSVSATYAKDGVTVGAIATSYNNTDLRWEATIPYILDECTIQVIWTFTVPVAGQIVKTDTYEVITPILTERQLKAIWPEATDDEIVEVESVVRYIIQANTGQTFGKRTKAVVVPGTGETALALPERILDITGLQTLTAVLNPSAAIIVADGWYLKKRWSDPVSTIENDDIYWQGEGVYDFSFPTSAPHGMGLTPDRYGHGQVISAPGSYAATRWKDDYPFTITGTWGYNTIPSAVQEAAKLLANDYACSEQSYRDRYLDSIKSADWRLQFNDKAFLKTGNVRADQLLDQYVMKKGWAVI